MMSMATLGVVTAAIVDRSTKGAAKYKTAPMAKT